MVVPDPEFSLRSQLDICFLPRAYLSSQDGKLTWLQKGPAVNLPKKFRSHSRPHKLEEIGGTRH